MLSAAKHLDAHRASPFATLRVTRERCHAERSEASRRLLRQALRFVLASSMIKADADEILRSG